MCGRYALALRASQVRQMLQSDNMAVDDSVDDDGPGAPRRSYNLAPGQHGVVYRADTPDSGAGPAPHGEDGAADAAAGPGQLGEPEDTGTNPVAFKLQAMKWGLVPSWTRKNPDYRSLMKTINCRDDSLSSPGGMWASIKGRKRCVVVAQGFFEWLKTGPRDKLPHYVRRKDGRLMCFAGLWDCVQYEGSDEKLYTYTIITTDSNRQLKFLHDRMPVVLDPGSDDMRRWVDPRCHHGWSRELQSLLRPFAGELDVYPVNKDVGKVGNDSPSFIVRLDSKENKSNIANFFNSAGESKHAKVVCRGNFAAETESRPVGGEEQEQEQEHDGEKPSQQEQQHEMKRKTPPAKGGSPPAKKAALGKAKISSTKNERRSPRKPTGASGSRKITSFFGNSA